MISVEVIISVEMTISVDMMISVEMLISIEMLNLDGSRTCLFLVSYEMILGS